MTSTLTDCHPLVSSWVKGAMESDSHQQQQHGQQQHQQQHQQPPLPPRQRCRAVVLCPRDYVGRVIGKSGATVKGIQRFSGAVVEIDQLLDPSTIIILGSAESVQMATSIVQDIIAGSFKGFGLLRQVVVADQTAAAPAAAAAAAEKSRGPLSDASAQYVYAPGFGMFPQRQLFAGAAAAAATTTTTPATLPVDEINSFRVGVSDDNSSLWATTTTPWGRSSSSSVDVVVQNLATSNRDDTSTTVNDNNSINSNNNAFTSAWLAFQQMTTAQTDAASLATTMEQCLQLYRQLQQQQGAPLGVQAMSAMRPPAPPFTSAPCVPSVSALHAAVVARPQSQKDDASNATRPLAVATHGPVHRSDMFRSST